MWKSQSCAHRQPKNSTPIRPFAGYSGAKIFEKMFAVKTRKFGCKTRKSVSKNEEFCIKKTRNFVFKMMNRQVLDMSLIKPGGKLHDPVLFQQCETSASFAILPAMNGYKGAISIGWKSLTMRHRSGKELWFENEQVRTQEIYQSLACFTDPLTMAAGS